MGNDLVVENVLYSIARIESASIAIFHCISPKRNGTINRSLVAICLSSF